MKTTATASAILAAFAFAGAALAADDHWTYDSAAGTISDGEWTFSAVVSGNSLTVNAFTGHPETLSVLDFSKPVSDVGGNNYVIVKLNPHLAHKKAGTDGGYRPGDLEASEASTKVGELILPQAGLTAISAAAFAYCSNLTNIVNYLPDSVTGIGNSAFVNCPAKQDLFLRGIRGNANRGIFYGSKIRSVTFGPGFTGISESSNKQRPFQNCSGITNIVFSSESSGISFVNNAFECVLKQPLILYGVKNLHNSAFSGCTIPSITFDKGIQSIGTLSSVSGLATVHFLGAPPSAQTGTWADYGQGSSKVTTYIYRKSNKTGEWNAYAEGGNIDMHNSTFSSTYATEPSKRPLLYIDKMAGYYISFK